MPSVYRVEAYRNAGLPVAKRVKDLLSRMDLPAYYNHKPSAPRGYLFDEILPLYAFGYAGRAE